jgi:hypothetical protein
MFLSLCFALFLCFCLSPFLSIYFLSFSISVFLLPVFLFIRRFVFSPLFSSFCLYAFLSAFLPAKENYGEKDIMCESKPERDEFYLHKENISSESKRKVAWLMIVRGSERVLERSTARGQYLTAGQLGDVVGANGSAPLEGDGGQGPGVDVLNFFFFHCPQNTPAYFAGESFITLHFVSIF